MRPEEGIAIRQHVCEQFQHILTNGDALIARLSPHNSATIYQLVFDPGNEGTPTLTDVASWAWLGPVLLDALRQRSVAAAANCGVLLGARVSGRGKAMVDDEVLSGFFGASASEVIQILDEMVEEIPESDRMLVRNVVVAASRSR